MHAVLLDYFGDEFAEEYEEVEFLTGEEEPRTLAEIVEAEAEFFDKVAFVRFVVRADRESGNYPEEIREEKFEEILASRADIAAKYGREELWKAIGSGHDEAWQYGYISGKLATLRWVLGSEWDFLDT